jgi:putative NADPH-quinone reductase
LAQRILILFAHPSLDRSEANVELLRASRGRDGVTVVDLYAEYPDYRIDIDREQERLRAHDVVVFLFPLYWYSTPALLKEWQDLVLEYGFAYGHEGNALRGKRFLCALTAGGPESAYRAEGLNHYTLRELLRPLEQTADLCGLRFLAPFALFGARTALEEGRLPDHVRDWGRVLDALRAGRVDDSVAQTLPTLNHDLDRVLRAAADADAGGDPDGEIGA